MSDAGPQLTCETCGATFQPKRELLERYPGWRPRSCPGCYAAAKKTQAAAEKSRGGATKPRASRSGVPTESLTVADVLARYSDGPDSGVFTDGSAIPNPGPGGWGAVYVVDGEIIAQDYGSDPHTTNNRMELLAILHGIELVPDGTPATVYTDSNLAAQTVNTWAAGWAARGWRRKTGPVENLDLVKALYEALQQRPELTVTWIRAHAGNRWNEYADSLSTAYRRDTL